ncbi:MAG: response regulator [Deltaproteobacteria bacterium]|nr:response regulator [Deltaproteobacteria bacterium]
MVLGLLVSVFLASSAWAQSAQEPIDLRPDAISEVRGLVPFHPGYLRDRVVLQQEDGWQERRIPGIEGSDGVPRGGWYRIHLRADEYPPSNLAVALPPTYGVWTLWFNSELIGGGGQTGPSGGVPAQERSRVLTVPGHLLFARDNVLALHIRSFEGLDGVGGAIRIGPPELLKKRARLAEGLSLGLAIAFLLLGLFAAILGFSDGDRLPTLLACTMLALALYGGTTSDWWYYFSDDTPTKIHLRQALFLLMHAGGLFLVEQLFVGRPDRGARAGALIGVALAGVSVALPLGTLFGLIELAWTLTGAAILYVVFLGRGLPVRSPFVRGGVRAGLVGLFIAVIFEVVDGSWGLPGVGPFQLVFLLVILTVAGVFALVQARARRRAMSVLRSSRDGLAVLDLRGRFVHANPALLTMLGVPAAEASRAVLDGRLSSDDAQRLRELLDGLANTRVGGSASSSLMPFRGAGDRELTVDVLGVRLDDLHLLISLRDVTERDRLEKEVARAQRLDSLGMLAGGIAHDFNNLLAGILVAATELEQDASMPRSLSARTQSIAESARRGGALTNRLLQFARGRVSPTVGVDLENELPDMLDMLGRTLGRNIEWSIDVQEDLPPVRVDEAELEQILVNLCVNARDAMAPRGGRITVKAWTALRDHEPVVGLEIADDGPGMSAELLARVIEPFVTTKGSGAGTGLGLAVVHGLAVARGGKMEIDSREGHGTKVRLYLPVQEVMVPAPVPDESLSLDQLRGIRVLLVEDEPSLRTFLSRALERRGLAVDVLADGEAVMPWILGNEGPEPPVDAVVMDMMMPVVDGMEASNALREVWPGIPVVISSGYTGRETIEPLLETGPTLLLEKPYQVDDLMKALARIVV